MAIAKVRLRSDHVEIGLSRRGLLSSISLQGNPTAEPVPQDERFHEDDIIWIRTETCIEPSGNGVKLIIKDDCLTAPNPNLAPLIAEAFELREAFLNGPYDSIEAMSKALQMGNGAITARIRLTLLSPHLIRRILNGDISQSLSQTRLLDTSKDLPVKWTEQVRFIETITR